MNKLGCYLKTLYLYFLHFLFFVAILINYYFVYLLFKHLRFQALIVDFLLQFKIKFLIIIELFVLKI